MEFEGRFDRVRHAGINPRPAREIPIWIGGMGRAVLERTGRLADGWLVRRSHYAAISGERREQDFEYRLGRIREAARASGRDPASIAVVCPSTPRARCPCRWRRRGAGSPSARHASRSARAIRTSARWPSTSRRCAPFGRRSRARSSSRGLIDAVAPRLPFLPPPTLYRPGTYVTPVRRHALHLLCAAGPLVEVVRDAVLGAVRDVAA